MPTMDQVVWANANVTVGGETQGFARGELLPEAGTAEELAERSLLRIGGALRAVEVVYTPDELAEQARLRGETTATREAALDTDPAVPSGQQMPGGVPAGRPTLVEPSGSPVVIGDEGLREEHAAQARVAEESRARQGPKPNAPKPVWVDYAVKQGQDRTEAEAMTRDQLVEKHGGVLAGQ
jgi:hypothetical protein